MSRTGPDSHAFILPIGVLEHLDAPAGKMVVAGGKFTAFCGKAAGFLEGRAVCWCHGGHCYLSNVSS